MPATTPRGPTNWRRLSWASVDNASAAAYGFAQTMTHRPFIGTVLLLLCAVGLATDAAADIRISSRALAAGLDRFGTRLIDAASDQESLSGDPAEEVRRAVLPVRAPGWMRVLDLDCVVSVSHLGACPPRSPPSA
jgi:hypothetical protein